MERHDTLVQNLVRHLADQQNVPPEDIQVIQTHISTIILCGSQAFKLKRDIKLPFLDYSTLELRRKACEEEYRINIRTAPEMYLDVLAVKGSMENPTLDASAKAPVIDWLVRMRRFDNKDLFSEKAKKGVLSFQEIGELARHIAAFHDQCAVIDEKTLQNTKSKEQWLLESLEEIRSAVPKNDSILGDCDFLERWSKTFWNNSQHHREMRAAQGFVRECHADLHLGNITIFNGKVMAFDAIDFSPELRQLDTIQEVAFVFMDLQAHKLPQHAWHFLNSYLHANGDYQGLFMLDYYMRYLAIVRAKVALLAKKHLHDNPLQDDAFRRYWTIALSGIAQRTYPMACLIAGLSGSGKSAASSILSRLIGAIWLRADVQRKRLFPDPSVRYTKDASRETYDHLKSTAHNLLQLGFNVIIDATFLEQWSVNLFSDLGKGLPSRTHTIAINCKAPPDLLKLRVNQRAIQGNDPSEATVQVLEQQILKQQTNPVTWPVPVYEVMNDQDLGDLEKKLTVIAQTLENGRD